MATEVRFADKIVIQQVFTSTLERDLDHFLINQASAYV